MFSMSDQCSHEEIREEMNILELNENESMTSHNF